MVPRTHRVLVAKSGRPAANVSGSCGISEERPISRGDARSVDQALAGGLASLRSPHRVHKETASRTGRTSRLGERPTPRVSAGCTHPNRSAIPPRRRRTLRQAGTPGTSADKRTRPTRHAGKRIVTRHPTRRDHRVNPKAASEGSRRSLAAASEQDRSSQVFFSPHPPPRIAPPEDACGDQASSRRRGDIGASAVAMRTRIDRIDGSRARSRRSTPSRRPRSRRNLAAAESTASVSTPLRTPSIETRSTSEVGAVSSHASATAARRPARRFSEGATRPSSVPRARAAASDRAELVRGRRIGRRSRGIAGI